MSLGTSLYQGGSPVLSGTSQHKGGEGGDEVGWSR